MQLRRAVVTFGLLGTGVVALAQGCQAPTQVTLELSLDRKARCQEIGSGTAISVGVEPSDTEARIATGFVTARTSHCDDATGQIGTLVVTPGESSRASVVVVAGYKGKDPATCTPPRYEGCIVARRRFAFAEHTRLRMPIAIDPDCADVPCDAFSTCSEGRCFDSQTHCTGSQCDTPGELADGGVDEAGLVEPDAGPIGPSDASDSGPPSPSCSPAGLICNGTGCDPSRPTCCFTSTGLTCEPTCTNADRACCATSDCAAGSSCVYEPNALVGRCQAADAGVDGGTQGPYCDLMDNLLCGGKTCGGANDACCGATREEAVCLPNTMLCPAGQQRFCCTANECGGARAPQCLRAITPVPNPVTPPAGLCAN